MFFHHNFNIVTVKTVFCCEQLSRKAEDAEGKDSPSPSPEDKQSRKRTTIKVLKIMK